MKRFLLSSVVLFGLAGAVVVAWPAAGAAVAAWARAGVAAVAPQKAADKNSKIPGTQPTSKPAAPINKFCAVEQENPVDPTVPTVVYEGKTIGFCCEDCPPKFKKDPKAYMKGLK